MKNKHGSGMKLIWPGLRVRSDMANEKHIPPGVHWFLRYIRSPRSLPGRKRRPAHEIGFPPVDGFLPFGFRDAIGFQDAGN